MSSSTKMTITLSVLVIVPHCMAVSQWIDCHEGQLLILHFGDETYAKLVRVVRALSQPYFVTSSFHFQ